RASFVWRLGANGTRLERTTFRFGAGVYSGVPRTGELLLPIESDRFSTGIKGGIFPLSPSVVINNFFTNSVGPNISRSHFLEISSGWSDCTNGKHVLRKTGKVTTSVFFIPGTSDTTCRSLISQTRS